MRNRWIVLIVTIFSLELSAAPTRFEMRDAGGRNSVVFISEGILEKTVGLSNAVSGWLEVDSERVMEGFKGEFEVDVRTFYTGIEQRNEFIREKLLGASEFPLATFSCQRIVSFSKNALFDGIPISLRVDGVLKMRGVQRGQTVTMQLTYLRQSEVTKQRLPGNLLKVSTSFDIDTQPYGFQIPEIFRLRFSRFVQVFVEILGTDQPIGLPVGSAAGASGPHAPIKK